MGYYIITHTDLYTKEYFFSTDHMQELDERFSACTHYIPHKVAKRPSCPTGIVDSKEMLKTIYYNNYKEIPNPDPQYQA